MTLIGTAFTLICNSGHKRIVKKFRTRLQAACLIIVSAYIHYHPQIPSPLVKQLGAIKTYYQQWSHKAHARRIGTVQLTVKLALWDACVH